MYVKIHKNMNLKNINLKFLFQIIVIMYSGGQESDTITLLL